MAAEAFQGMMTGAADSDKAVIAGQSGMGGMEREERARITGIAPVGILCVSTDGPRPQARHPVSTRSISGNQSHRMPVVHATAQELPKCNEGQLQHLLSRTTTNSAKARLPVALILVTRMPVAVPALGKQLTVTHSPAR